MDALEKKQYESPTLSVALFSESDVIATSDGINNGFDAGEEDNWFGDDSWG